MNVKKYFSGFFVGILFGAVGETLFKMVDVVEVGTLPFVLMHIGLVVSLIFSAWVFNRISDITETIDRISANEFLTLDTNSEEIGEKKILSHRVYKSYLYAFGLPENSKDVAKELDKVRSKFILAIIGATISFLFLAACIIMNICKSALLK